jgi:hypothetical protein
MPITLACIIIGQATAFTVTINETQYVDELKDEIKKKQQHNLAEVDADQLTLYKVNIDVSTKELLDAAKLAIFQSSIEYEKEELEGLWELSTYFQESGPPENAIPKRTIHILVQLPRGESINPRAWS